MPVANNGVYRDSLLKSVLILLVTGILRGGLDPKEILSETNSSFAPENRLGPHKENLYNLPIIEFQWLCQFQGG